MDQDVTDEPQPQPGERLTVPKRNYTALGCGCVGLLAVAVAVFFVFAANKGEQDLGSGPAATKAAALASSSSPGSASTSTAVHVRDIPALDLTGSGDACMMTYGPSASGGTLTEFRFKAAGEIITHVSGTDGAIQRNDQHVKAGTVDSCAFEHCHHAFLIDCAGTCEGMRVALSTGCH